MTIPLYTGEVPALNQSQPEFDTNTQAFIDYIAELAPELNEFAESLNNLSTTGTSTTSNAVGTGSKAFTTQAGKGFFEGQSLTIARTSAPTNRMFAVVDSYNSGTGALVVTSQAFEGSGTFTDWTITLGFNGVVGTEQIADDAITTDKIEDDAITAAKIEANLLAELRGVGEYFDWPFADTPSYGLFCNGATVSSATYAALFAKSVKTSVVTMTIATPGVLTWEGHPLYVNAPVKFTTTGALPTGIVAGTTYYVIAAGLAADSFRISATIGGAAINTTGVQSGVHTAIHAPHGCANDLSTFNVPNFAAGYAALQANANEGLNTIGQVLAHVHDYVRVPAGGGTVSGGAVFSASFTTAQTTNQNPAGGSANYAAGAYVRKCIRF
jgi:hypothetical protein